MFAVQTVVCGDICEDGVQTVAILKGITLTLTKESIYIRKRLKLCLMKLTVTLTCMWNPSTHNYQYNCMSCMHALFMHVVWSQIVLMYLQDSFNISDGIDGSAASYTITYSDSTSATVAAVA